MAKNYNHPIGFVLISLCVWVSLAKRSSRQVGPEELFKKQQENLEHLKKLAEEGGHKNPDEITTFDKDVCYTDDCLEAAEEYLIATNFKEDPCGKSGSWLKFTCVRRTMIQGNENEDMYQQSQVGYTGSVAVGQTLDILEEENHPSEIMKKAALYYKQCEQWKYSDNDTKIDTILSYLSSMGEWPLLTGKDSPGENFDWKKMMSNTLRVAVAYGVAPYLFDIFIEEEDIPLLFTGELTLHKEDSEIAEIINILSKGQRKIEKDDKQIKEMREFMESLTHPSEDNIEVAPVKNISANHDFGKNFDLEDFYRLMLSGTRVQITPESEVAADITWLEKHVKQVNEAEPRVIANLLFLQTAAALLTRLTRLAHSQKLPTLEKYRSNGPMDCMRETYEKFDYAMSHEYLRKYYDHKGTTALVKLVDNLKEGFANTIEKAEFLTSRSKVHAIDKAKDIHTFIGADAWVMDEAQINEYYKNLNISNDENFVKNHVAGLRFAWGKFLELQNANIFNYLVGDSYTGYVSSKYSYHFNQLRIQAALAQKPLFSPNYPGFMNYGGIGTILAHTLGHGLDTNGVHFDKNGRRGDFWEDLSYEGYYNWTDSLVEDYSSDKYTAVDPWGSFANSNYDHTHLVNDDVADIVGIHMAYRAYQKYLNDLEKEGKKELVLPGLKDFKPQQLFWMKYANMWCEHTDKSYLNALRDFYMHSPGNIRATFPISRSKEWANDFNCPAPENSEF